MSASPRERGGGGLLHRPAGGADEPLATAENERLRQRLMTGAAEPESSTTGR
jgi:hypothetical protein